MKHAMQSDIYNREPTCECFIGNDYELLHNKFATCRAIVCKH